ncbi:hypothetical protein ACHAPU_010395 [Fusarium lateritium]
MMQSKNVNRDKSLYVFATRTLEKDPERHHELKERVNRMKNGEKLPEGDFATFKELVRELYGWTLQDVSGVIASTPVGITPPRFRESLQPDLVIVDEAATMDEMPISHPRRGSL